MKPTVVVLSVVMVLFITFFTGMILGQAQGENSITCIQQAAEILQELPVKKANLSIDPFQND